MLQQIRELSSKFDVTGRLRSATGLSTKQLEGLERDLHTHNRLENHSLFPRAVDMDAAR